jgi:hypothetical protein
MTPQLFDDRGGRIHKDFSKSIVMTIPILDALAYRVPKDQVARIPLRMWLLVKCNVSHKEKLKNMKSCFVFWKVDGMILVNVRLKSV